MGRLAPANLVTAALLLLLGGCGHHAPGPKAYTDDHVRWGPPVDGLMVGIARRTYAPKAAPGLGQVYFSIQMRNVSQRTMSILAPVPMGGTIPEDRSGDESVKVKLTYDSAAGVRTAQFTPAKKPVVQTIEPGAEYHMELRLSPEKFGLHRFVTGRMSATYSNSQGTIQYRSTGDAPVHGLWTGDATSGAVGLHTGPSSASSPSRDAVGSTRVAEASAGGASR